MTKDSFKTSTGKEVLIGINVYNKFAVSCWDDDYNCIWAKTFDNETDAREYFDKVETDS